jgi:hypothetical protein
MTKTRKRANNRSKQEVAIRRVLEGNDADAERVINYTRTHELTPPRASENGIEGELALRPLPANEDQLNRRTMILNAIGAATGILAVGIGARGLYLQSEANNLAKKTLQAQLLIDPSWIRAIQYNYENRKFLEREAEALDKAGQGFRARLVRFMLDNVKGNVSYPAAMDYMDRLLFVNEDDEVVSFLQMQKAKVALITGKGREEGLA